MRTKPASCKYRDAKHYYLDWGGDPRFKVCLFCGAMPGRPLLRVLLPPRVVPLLLFGQDTPPIDPMSKAARRMQRRFQTNT